MYGKLILAILYFIRLALAETDPAFDVPVISSPSTSNGASTDSIVTRVDNATLHNADEVQQSNVEQTGREDKATQADKQGQTGTGMAIATGTALMAQAIPMLASPIPSVQAAGAVLMSQAGMEFAQAGADAASSDKNKAQYKMLTNQKDDSPGSQTTADQIKKAMSSEALDKLLADKGINSEDFKNQLASGQLNDAEGIRNMMGMGNVDAQDLAAADSLAQDSLNGVFAELHPGEQLSNSVQVNEELTPSATGLSEGGSDVASLSGGANKGLSDTHLEGVGALNGTVSGKTGSSKGLLADAIEKGIAAAGFDAKGMLDKLLGKDASKTNGAAQAALLRSQLAKAGILVPTSKLSIFQTARRNFRAFGKWRKTYRVAMGTTTSR